MQVWVLIYINISGASRGVHQIDISFGAGHSGFSFLGNGWAEPELNHVWAVGPRSTLVLPALDVSRGGHRALMSVKPPPGSREQTLHLTYNSKDLGHYRIGPDRTLEFRLGEGDSRHGLNILEIVPRYCVSPAALGINEDSREMSFSLEALSVTKDVHGTDDGTPGTATLGDRQLMMGFESLGDDCELGFVQRSVGAEPLSLLRFGGIRLHRLYEALGNRFDGIDDVAELGVSIQGGQGHGEYMIVQNRYRYFYHTFMHSWEIDRDALLAREAARLAFCRRKLLEDLEDGEKIFVVKSSSDPALRLDQVMPVAERVAGFGGAVTFWATAADAGHPPGTLQWHGPTLLEGRLDRLCPPGHAPQFSPFWLALCRKAHREAGTRAG